MFMKTGLLAGLVAVAVMATFLLSGSDASAQTTEEKATTYAGSETQSTNLVELICDECIPDDLLDIFDDVCPGDCIDDKLEGGTHVLIFGLDVNRRVDLKGATNLQITIPEHLQQGGAAGVGYELTGLDADGKEIKINVELKILLGWFMDGADDDVALGLSGRDIYENEVFSISPSPDIDILNQDMTTLHQGQNATVRETKEQGTGIDPCDLIPVAGAFLACELTFGFTTTAQVTGKGVTMDREVEVKGGDTLTGGTINFPKGQFVDPASIPCSAPAGSLVNLNLTNKQYAVNVDATGKADLIIPVVLDIPIIGFEITRLSFNLNDLFGLGSFPIFDGLVTANGTPADNTRLLGTVEKDKIQPVIEGVDISLNPLEGKKVTFTATATDNCNSGADLSYVWNFSDGGTGFGSQTIHVFAESGNYSGNVTVTDKAGNQDTRDFSVTVAEGGSTNIKYEGPISMGPQTDDEIELSAVLVDQTGDPIKGRTLDFFIDDDGHVPFLAAASNVTDVNGRARVSLRPNLPPGSYVVGVVFDGDATYDGSAFGKKFTVFTNQPPVVSPLADPGKHVWGVPIEFSGFATDPDGGAQDTLKYVWDFGDGTTAINNKVSHAYDKPSPAGEPYVVTLTVTDKDGAVSEVRTTVTINKRDTAIKNCGDIQVPSGQRTVNDCARLIDSEKGQVIGKTITFTMTIAGTPITNSGLTDANGELRTAFNRNMPAGCFAADIDFAAFGPTGTPDDDNLYNPAHYDYNFYTSGNGAPQNCLFSAGSSAGYDVNCDGSANAVDALYLLQVVAGLTNFVSCEHVANVNGDSVIDPLDALTILQYAVGG